jgi:2-phosphosulfolactate phosphatase
MKCSMEVLFTPAEFEALEDRNISEMVCVVFDVLRATSSMITALANGARAIIPVAEISEALALRAEHPELLLAGERHGVRILADQTGSIDFDLGNSPREFAPEVVRAKTIVITTTNGSRALRACARARRVFIGSFLGLSAVAGLIREIQPDHLLLVCAGTYDQASYEDTLAAGALADAVWPLCQAGQAADSAFLARLAFQQAESDLLGAMAFARNGRRLLAMPDLRGDVPFCLQRDTVSFVAEMTPQGEVRRRT